MSRDKPILIILTPGFPESESDSTCLPAHQSFVRTVKELYPQMEIIVLSFQYPYHQKRYDWHGIPVIPFGGRNKGGIAKLLMRKKILSLLNETRKTRKIVGLLSFWYNECALVGKKFGDKWGIKHYCWIRGQDAKKENDYPRRIPPREDELIALSDFLQAEFEKNHGVRPRWVVPPGIDPKEFSSPAPAKNIDIMAAGSLILLKRFEIFIETIAEIKKQIPSVKAVLAGEGPERKKLEELIYEKGLSSTITMTGELSHPELLKMTQRAKILLHPSSYEGFGVVILEALCAGAGVCSFVKPMNDEIENWHIVRTKEEMIATAINILQSPGSGYQPVIPYPMDAMAKRIMELFSA